MIEKYKKSLVAPLDEAELHIFNADEPLQNVMEAILNIMRNKVYGIYLIGGLRGCGKTSLMNLCCRLSRFPQQIKVRIDCNKLVDTGNFLYFFICSLEEALRGKKITDDIVSEVEDLKDVVSNHKLKKQFRESKSLQEAAVARQTIEQSRLSASFKLLKNLLFAGTEASAQNSEAYTYGRQETYNQIEEKQESYEQYKLLEHLTDILKRLSDEHEVLIIVDELDKKDKNFIHQLMEAYKNLFLNSHIIIFLLVDLVSYLELKSGNELDNQLLSYINRGIYVPSNSFESLQKYVYRELDVDDMRTALIINYLSLGLFRKINLYHYLEGEEDRDIFLKSYLYQELVSDYKKGYCNKLELDLFRIYTKEMIERLFAAGNVTEQEALTYQDSRPYFRVYHFAQAWLSGLNRISCMQELIKRRMLKEKAYELNLNGFPRYEIEQEYQNKKLIQPVSAQECSRINREMPYNRHYEYIKIVNRDEYSFKYIIRLIDTLIKDIDNLWIVRKIVNFYGEQYAYSVLVDVGKEVGRILYCIEDFSFSYECAGGIKLVREFMEKHAIPIIEIETDDEPVKKSLDFIIETVKKKINGG